MKPRRLQFERLESRTVLSTIVGELSADAATSQADPVVAFHLQVSDATGEVASSFNTGEELFLRVLVEDLRPEALGVFAAMLDVLFNSDLAMPTGSPEFGEPFPNMHLASCGAGGVLDEIGAVGSMAAPGSGPLLLMQIPFVAVAPGSLMFSADPADLLPANEVLVHGWNETVPLDRIQYGSVQIEIAGSPWTETASYCDSAIPKGPVAPLPESEEIAAAKVVDYEPFPVSEMVSETGSYRATGVVTPVNQYVGWGFTSARLQFPELNVALVNFLAPFAEPAFGAGLVDLPPLAGGAKVVVGPAASKVGQTDRAPTTPDVQLSVELPIGTAPVTNISVIAAAESPAPISESELEELLTDSPLLSLLGSDLNTDP